MKKIVFLLVMAMSFCGTYAQTVKLTKSEIKKDSKRFSLLKYSLADEKGGLITIRETYSLLQPRAEGYLIDFYDENLKLVKELDQPVAKTQLRNAFVKDGKLHLIEYELRKKEDKISFTATTFNLSNYDITVKEILSISRDEQNKTYDGSFGSYSFTNLNNYDSNHEGEVVLSKENNFFVINFDAKNKKKETHKIFVFNSNLDKVYSQVIQKDIKDKLFYYKSIDIDDKDGTVYFVGKAYENKKYKNKKDGKANYHFELYKVNADNQTVTSFKREDKYVTSMKLLKGEDRIACVGLYGNNNTARLHGVCLFNLDPETLEMQSEYFNPFSDEFLTDKYGNKTNKKKKNQRKGLSDFDFKSLFMMSNGDIVVNGEEYYVTRITNTTTDGKSTTTTTYHFNDIISMRVDKNGKLLWARNINKRQTGLANSSFTSLPVGGNSYFFINCSDKIKTLSANRIHFNQTKAKKSNLYMIKIAEDGKMSHEKLIDDKESKVYYKVNSGSVDFDNESVTLVGKRNKKSRVLKIEL